MRKIIFLVLILVGCSFFESYAQNRLYTSYQESDTTYIVISFPWTTSYITVINDGAETDTLDISTSPLFDPLSTIKRTGGEIFNCKWSRDFIYIRVGSWNGSTYTYNPAIKFRVEAQ